MGVIAAVNFDKDGCLRLDAPKKLRSGRYFKQGTSVFLCQSPNKRDGQNKKKNYQYPFHLLDPFSLNDPLSIQENKKGYFDGLR
jgi:hypothetical protein